MDRSAADTAFVGPVQRWLAGALMFALVAGGAVATPFAAMPLPVVSSYNPMWAAAMIVINLLLAALLLIKGSIEENGDAIRLSAAYLFVCGAVIVLMACLPDGFMPKPLLGGLWSARWVWCLWHLGFALALLRYAWFAHHPVPVPSSLIWAIAGPLAALFGVVLIAIVLADLSPVSGPISFAPDARVAVGLMTVTVIALVAVIRLGAATPERLWLIVGLLATCFEVWLSVQSTARFSLGWYLAKAGSLVTALAMLIALLHEITRLYAKVARSNLVLMDLANRDGLTGLANRRRFDEMLQRESRRARLRHLSLGVVLLDVDRFKAYNDRYGHQAGDECLRQVSRAVAGALLRPADLAARYGGEEIVVLLPATDESGAFEVAERIRAAVESLGIEHLGSEHRIVTVSVGASAVFPTVGHEPLAQLVGVADRALYQAKAAGRNQVRGAAAAATSEESAARLVA